MKNITVIFVLFLSACGFQPMYGKTGVGDSLAQIKIERIQDRIGQILHNELRNMLTPAGVPQNPQYILEVTQIQRVRSLGVRQDRDATRANLETTVSYKLLDAQSIKSMTQGRTKSVVSYNRFDFPFNTEETESDARERGLKVVAENITRELSLFFAK